MASIKNVLILVAIKADKQSKGPGKVLARHCPVTLFQVSIGGRRLQTTTNLLERLMREIRRRTHGRKSVNQNGYG